jgi:hypothetical protein
MTPPGKTPATNMTTKTYQAELPFRNHRIVKPIPMPRPPLPPELIAQEDRSREIRAKLKHQLDVLLTEGFWICSSCEQICDRIESDNGQPASCSTCGSHKITWNPPINEALRKEKV